jgi:hypothetical protein
VLGERAEVRYRMAFNQVAEGWSWQPLADPAVDDYYRYKFLPLQSVAVERGEYAHEDKIGVTAANEGELALRLLSCLRQPLRFYPRSVDDDAGFSADLPAAAGRASRDAGAGPPDRAGDQREHDFLEGDLRQAHGLHAEEALPGRVAGTRCPSST